MSASKTTIRAIDMLSHQGQHQKKVIVFVLDSLSCVCLHHISYLRRKHNWLSNSHRKVFQLYLDPNGLVA